MQALFALLLLVGVSYVHGHGVMTNPLGRHALQFLPESQRPGNWWDRTFWDAHGVWCGNVPQDINFSNCGRCGDPPGRRDFDLNGVYGHPIITGTYSAGQNIRVDLEFGAQHHGYVQIDLCPQTTETDTCFQSLIITGGSQRLRNNRQMCVPNNEDGTRREHVNVQLPAGVRCTRCTLRWTYRTSYPGPHAWDPCFDSRQLAQTFRSCSNIRIN